MRHARSILLVCGLVAVMVAGSLALTSGPKEMAPQPAQIITTMLRDPAPFHDAVNTAELIVIGEVQALGEPVLNVASHGFVGQAPVVWTPITLAVERTLKGEVGPGGTVTFAQLGGTAGGVARVFVDQARFSKGERVLLFLYKPTGAFVEWTGGNLYADEGKYVLGEDGLAHNILRDEKIGLDTLVKSVLTVLSMR